jgi:Flp pilus assembly protein TadB
MNKKALRLYGIGEARRASRLNPAIMFWVLPGLAFVGFASVSSALAGRIDSADAFALVLGGVLLLAGFWADRRQRKFDADLPSQSRQGQ